MLNFFSKMFHKKDKKNSPADTAAAAGQAPVLSAKQVGAGSTRDVIDSLRKRPAMKVAGRRRGAHVHRHRVRKEVVKEEADEQDLVTFSKNNHKDDVDHFVSNGPKWSEMPTRKRGAKRTHRVKVNQPRNRGCN